MDVWGSRLDIVWAASQQWKGLVKTDWPLNSFCAMKGVWSPYGKRE